MAGLRRAQTPPGTTPNTAGYFQYPAAPGAAPADAWTPPRLDPPYETGARSAAGARSCTAVYVDLLELPRRPARLPVAAQVFQAHPESRGRCAWREMRRSTGGTTSRPADRAATARCWSSRSLKRR